MPIYYDGYTPFHEFDFMSPIPVLHTTQIIYPLNIVDV